MNANSYRLVFSRARGMFTAVAESARTSRCGSSGQRAISRSSRPRGVHRAGPLVAAFLAIGWVPALVGAAGSLPAGVLPIPSAQFVSQGSANVAVSGAQMTVTQSSQNAILRWDAFNISSNSAVTFKQPNSTSVALNRIFSADPSRIEGRLSANGQIYLINQNGIVFANGAQVNVYSLVASTLDISDALFTAGLLSNPRPAQDPAFTPFANGAPSGAIVVENGAQIRTQSGGRVMLLASDITNNGIIQTPDGQTILAAGAKAYVAASQDVNLRGFLVEVDNGGSASNMNLGQIIAERGNVSLVGLAVNQNGLIRATTSINANGSIRLLARDSVVPVDVPGGPRVPQGGRGGIVTVGAGARTEVLPDASDTATSQDSQPFNRSSIEMTGLSVHLGKDSQIVAPGGVVTLTAMRGATFQPPGAIADPDAKVYFEDGSVVDVSGTQDAAISMARNSVAVELRGNELRDSPQIRNGPLRGQTVYVDARTGTPLADVSGYIAQIQRGVDERLASGGDISIRSEGSVVLPTTATLNVTGGRVSYLGGPLRTSKLLGADGRIYDIGTADPSKVYVGILGSFTVTSSKWGVSKT
jgi:filamentous hemagglutinin